MKKIPCILLIIAAAMMIVMNGCHNDNNDKFNEYTNPIADNPVNTIDWLKEKKDVAKLSLEKMHNNNTSGRKVKAFIKIYTYQKQDYYEITYGEVITDEYRLPNFNSDVFDWQGKLCVSIIGGDAVGTQPGNEHLCNFWNSATFKSLLWEYNVKN